MKFATARLTAFSLISLATEEVNTRAVECKTGKLGGRKIKYADIISYPNSIILSSNKTQGTYIIIYNIIMH